MAILYFKNKYVDIYIIKCDIKQIIGNCSFKKFQACKIEKDLKEGDKVCITYTKSKYKKEYHIYQIDLIK